MTPISPLPSVTMTHRISGSHDWQSRPGAERVLSSVCPYDLGHAIVGPHADGGPLATIDDHSVTLAQVTHLDRPDPSGCCHMVTVPRAQDGRQALTGRAMN